MFSGLRAGPAGREGPFFLPDVFVQVQSVPSLCFESENRVFLVSVFRGRRDGDIWVLEAAACLGHQMWGNLLSVWCLASSFWPWKPMISEDLKGGHTYHPNLPDEQVNVEDAFAFSCGSAREPPHTSPEQAVCALLPAAALSALFSPTCLALQSAAAAEDARAAPRHLFLETCLPRIRLQQILLSRRFNA